METANASQKRTEPWTSHRSFPKVARSLPQCCVPMSSLTKEGGEGEWGAQPALTASQAPWSVFPQYICHHAHFFSLACVQTYLLAVRPSVLVRVPSQTQNTYRNHTLRGKLILASDFKRSHAWSVCSLFQVCGKAVYCVRRVWWGKILTSSQTGNEERHRRDGAPAAPFRAQPLHGLISSSQLHSPKVLLCSSNT